MTTSPENPILVKFREQCMKRGAASIKGISVFWHNIDDDNSRTLTFDEFWNGIENHNISLKKEEASELFKLFDKNGSGNIDYEEFLSDLRVS